MKLMMLMPQVAQQSCEASLLSIAGLPFVAGFGGVCTYSASMHLAHEEKFVLALVLSLVSVVISAIEEEDEEEEFAEFCYILICHFVVAVSFRSCQFSGPVCQSR